MFHDAPVYRQCPVGMVELNEIAVICQPVNHELFLGQEYWQDVVEFFHFLNSESIEMEFKEIVSVLVYSDVERRIDRMRGQSLVIGESENLVAVAHVV